MTSTAIQSKLKYIKEKAKMEKSNDKVVSYLVLLLSSMFFSIGIFANEIESKEREKCELEVLYKSCKLGMDRGASFVLRKDAPEACVLGLKYSKKLKIKKLESFFSNEIKNNNIDPNKFERKAKVIEKCFNESTDLKKCNVGYIHASIMIGEPICSD